MQANNVIIPSSEEDGIIKWDWTKHYMDFGFPLSLQGHIFRTSDIKGLIKNVRFLDPDSLEDGLQIYDSYPKEKMAAFENNVSLTCLTKITTKELNDLYLQSQNINIESFDFSNINSCQQELEFTID